MADWTFIDDYGAKYPSLAGSALSLLSFSSHSIQNTAFTGTLDVAATPAFTLLGELTGSGSFAFTGTVTEQNNQLSVSLTCDSGLAAGLMTQVPIIGPRITAATMRVLVAVATTDDPDDEPAVNQIDLSVTFTVGSASVTISAQVPLAAGFLPLTGTFTGVGISLSDLDFLIKGGGGGSDWFPTAELGPYASGSPSFSLISITLTLYVVLQPTISMKYSSVSVEIGITNIPLMDQRLYLNPLAVVVTVPSGDPTSPASIGLVGDVVLCSYKTPGNTTAPDATLELQMGLTDFSVSAQLLVPEGQTGLGIKELVSDLMGAETDIGLPDTLTLTEFNMYAQADKSQGKISSFATEIAMSGGFGLFTDFDIQSFDLSLEYDA